MASYQCDRCLKRFSSYYNVRRHKANHCAYANIDDNGSMEEERGSSYSDEQSVDSFPVTETEEDENSENSCEFMSIMRFRILLRILRILLRILRIKARWPDRRYGLILTCIFLQGLIVAMKQGTMQF